MLNVFITMRAGFIRNLSYSGLQLLLNQSMAFVIFLFLSRYLTKDEFGMLSWWTAILVMAYTIISGGLDQVLIKKLAGGSTPKDLLGVYTFHCFTGGIIFYGMLTCILPFIKGSLPVIPIALAAGRLFFLLTLPYKSLVNGKEQFSLLFLMSVPSNLVKAAGISILYLTHSLALKNVVLLMMAGDLTELLVCLLVSKRRYFSFFIFWPQRKTYLSLLKESLPQFGVVFFTLALARFDQVIMGWFSSTSALADYSFATRIYELSTLPLLILGPLLLPMFSRMKKSGTEPSMKLELLLRVEIMLACFSFLALNLFWTALIDPLTNGKYGQINESTILILSCSIPLVYLNNFFWTLNFAEGKLKMILVLIASTFVLNALLDLMLIPSMGGVGAAIAYSASILFQTGFYFRKTVFTAKGPLLQNLLLCFLSAFLLLVVSRKIAAGNWAITLSSLPAFSILLLLLKQVRKNDLPLIKKAIRQ